MRLHRHLDGPAPAWPRPLDVALEWWAGLPTRGRVAVRAAAAVVVLAAATGGLVEGRWGPPTPVLVAARDIAPGAAVTAADLDVVRWPRDLLPDQALRDPASLPADAVADGRLTAGTPVTARTIRGGGPAAAATPGTAVVPVPLDAVPTLPIGTRLDLAVAGLDGGTTIVARGAVLVADDGAWRWLRIDRAALEAVARGVSDLSLVVGVLPPEPADGP